MKIEELEYDRIFAELKQKSNCPFAQRANVEVFSWNEKISTIENLELLSIQLKKLIFNVNSHGLAVIMASHYGDSVPTLARTTKNILCYLGSIAPYNCMQSDLETKEYQFTFFSTRFFILTLGTAYPSTHSRYTFGIPATVIFFQPELSFEEKQVCKTTQAINIRNNIRNLFRKAGRSYDNFLVMGKEVAESIDIYKYVKPYHKNDAPVRWWEDNQ